MTFKNHWSIVYDMIYNNNTSGFGKDPIRKCVMTEKSAWDAYLWVCSNLQVIQRLILVLLRQTLQNI